MRYVYTLAVIVGLLIPAAAAADDATSALAGQVVSAAVAPGIDARIERMIGEAVAKQPTEMQPKMRADLTEAVAPIRADLLKVFAGYYTRSFSEAELKELLAFYQGPVGAKVVRVEAKKPAEMDAQIEQRIMKIVMLVNTPPAK